MAFEWIQCSFFLKKNIENTQITINLTPYHKLKYLNEENQLKDIPLAIRIEFQKPLMYDDNIGWNWHKSWNIPDISVEIISCENNLNCVLDSLKNLYMEIYVVKPIISKEYSLCIEDLGLQGNTCIQLPNNKGTFSGLKFSATSYNNQGSKFHFLLVIYQRSEGNSDEQSKIVLSRISSPIFVDSRKSARQAELIKLKKISAYIQPFDTTYLSKKFVKKQSKRSKDYCQQQIQNNLNGLYNYFGAANIRNKVKHPLFLAIKFDFCFTIYVNKRFLHNSVNNSSSSIIKNQLNILQQALFQIYKNNFQIQSIISYNSSTKISSKIQNDSKKIIVALKTQNLIGRISHTKKIPQFLQIFNNQTTGVILDGIQSIPIENFNKLEITKQLIQQYQLLVQKFKKENDQLFRSKQIQLKNAPLQIIQPILPIKKFSKISNSALQQQSSITQNNYDNSPVKKLLKRNRQDKQQQDFQYIASDSIEKNNQRSYKLRKKNMFTLKSEQNTVKEIQKQIEKVQNEQNEDIQSSSYPFLQNDNYIPNIALKCQIQIDPWKRRAPKLIQVLRIYEQGDKKWKEPIKSQRKLLSNTKQLKILNDLIKIQIQDRKMKMKQCLNVNNCTQNQINNISNTNINNKDKIQYFSNLSYEQNKNNRISYMMPQQLSSNPMNHINYQQLHQMQKLQQIQQQIQTQHNNNQSNMYYPPNIIFNLLKY